MNMKSIKEWISDGGQKMLAEGTKKLLSKPDEIDASNPAVKKLLAACDKNGYKLLKAFSKINSQGKPSGWYTISVMGYGPGYHPDVCCNINGKAGEMFYLRINLKTDAKTADAKMYAEGLSKGAAMVEALNKVDGTKLPGLLF